MDVEACIIEQAAESRAAERSTLRDPPTVDDFKRLIRSLPDKDQRRYAGWLYRVCETEEPDSLQGTLDAMFIGKHVAALPDGMELLDGLCDLVRWRMHFNDSDADVS